MADRPLTTEERVADLYQRTEDLLTALERVQELLGIHTRLIQSHNKAINSLIPLADRKLAGDIQ